MTLFHTAATNADACAVSKWKWLRTQVASIIMSMLCGSRSWELPFLLYRYELENAAVSFLLYFVVCNKSELV